METVKELRGIALHRLKNDKNNKQMANEARNQLSITEIENDGSSNTTIKIKVSPMERRDVAKSILRAFDKENDIQRVRFVYAMLRVREEATLYLCFFMILLGMSVLLTVGSLGQPLHYNRFLVAASDKVAGQDVNGLPPPNSDFAEIQSIDHWYLWMNGAVMSNLFPTIPIIKNESNELHQYGLLDGSLIMLEHSVRIRQVRRLEIPCSILTIALSKKDSGGNVPTCVSSTYQGVADFETEGTHVGLTYQSNAGAKGIEIPYHADQTTHQKYPSGGYIVTLNTLDPIGSKLKWKNLVQQGFIDEKTAAIFVTYAMYNPDLKAVALIRALTEFFPSKRNEPSLDRRLLKTESMFNEKGEVYGLDVFKIISEIILCYLAIRYLLIELEELVGQKYCKCCQLLCCQYGRSCNHRKKKLLLSMESNSTTSNRKINRTTNKWCTPLKWRWKTYFTNWWNFIDVSSCIIFLMFCSLQIWVHVLKAQVNSGGLGDTTNTNGTNAGIDGGASGNIVMNQWEVIITATRAAGIADDLLALGFFMWGIKLFKIVQLVPMRAGRIFEAIGGTLVAERVVVLLAFLFLLIVIFSLSFYMMYSGDDDDYGTIIGSFFSTYNNMLGDSDYEQQKSSNFILGQFLWFFCVLTLTIIMLNIFIAVVSVEYEDLEKKNQNKICGSY